MAGRGGGGWKTQLRSPLRPCRSPSGGPSVRELGAHSGEPTSLGDSPLPLTLRVTNTFNPATSVSKERPQTTRRSQSQVVRGTRSGLLTPTPLKLRSREAMNSSPLQRNESPSEGPPQKADEPLSDSASAVSFGGSPVACSTPRNGKKPSVSWCTTDRAVPPAPVSPPPPPPSSWMPSSTDLSQKSFDILHESLSERLAAFFQRQLNTLHLRTAVASWRLTVLELRRERSSNREQLLIGLVHLQRGGRAHAVAAHASKEVAAAQRKQENIGHFVSRTSRVAAMPPGNRPVRFLQRMLWSWRSCARFRSQSREFAVRLTTRAVTALGRASGTQSRKAVLATPTVRGAWVCYALGHWCLHTQKQLQRRTRLKALRGLENVAATHELFATWRLVLHSARVDRHAVQQEKVKWTAAGRATFRLQRAGARLGSIWKEWRRFLAGAAWASWRAHTQWQHERSALLCSCRAMYTWRGAACNAAVDKANLESHLSLDHADREKDSHTHVADTFFSPVIESSVFLSEEHGSRDAMEDITGSGAAVSRSILDEDIEWERPITPLNEAGALEAKVQAMIAALQTKPFRKGPTTPRSLPCDNMVASECPCSDATENLIGKRASDAMTEASEAEAKLMLDVDVGSVSNCLDEQNALDSAGRRTVLFEHQPCIEKPEEMKIPQISNTESRHPIEAEDPLSDSHVLSEPEEEAQACQDSRPRKDPGVLPGQALLRRFALPGRLGVRGTLPDDSSDSD